jgi:hypothetical protein
VKRRDSRTRPPESEKKTIPRRLSMDEIEAEIAGIDAIVIVSALSSAFIGVYQRP